MYVQPASRGQGAAGKLLALLECKARQAGCPVLMLETGPKQPEALGFYESRGFVRRPPFGDYRDDPLSVFMHKPIAAVAMADAAAQPDPAAR
jgi:putative acetyltransferase